MTTKDFIKNFPFISQRNNQTKVLNEICEAFNSGYKYILLEAPTGFGKSAVAVSVAKTLGSSYICTSTKDLQTQYARDFSFIKVAKGKSNFPCLVKDDFIKNGIYRCRSCISAGDGRECYHTTVEYGPCMTDESFEGTGCKYRTFLKDYDLSNKGTENEKIYINNDKEHHYKTEFFQWLHLKNLKDNNRDKATWRPCEYFDQLNIALTSSHSIFNYSNFLAFLPSKKIIMPRELLVLDEAHLLETEIVKFRGLSISKKRWRRYIKDLKIVDYGYNEVKRWIDFLIELETKMLTLIGNISTIEDLSLERKILYNWQNKNDEESKAKTSDNNDKKVIPASVLFDSDKEIEEKYSDTSKKDTNKISDELFVEATRDAEKLTRAINNILSNPKNWIISDIKKENFEVIKVELKPLDISEYCQAVFEKCSKTLIMSATILNDRTFCRSVGLATPSYDKDVKFIRIPSDFPVEKRLIYPLSIEYLNFNNLQSEQVKNNIVKAIDNLMYIHRYDKGIIHTTSYEQLNFIKENVSHENGRRLIVTDPDIQRDEVLKQHIDSIKPTVLISPSLHTGLDLKDDLSRFQIITKVPYPNKGDRWTNAKREIDEEWYYWQTALKLIQAYGRSIRSKEDWAKTYVLDSAFGYFVKKNKNILPDWFALAIKGS
ncbi:MAG TPA: ATP-dependent DNA helicase [Nitrososphaeraceae archaeon]|nr:ATP-dependent DNA helicase [Nitrososphaeraceae archaeon]